MYVRMLLGFVLLSIGFMSPVASATGLVKPLLQAAGLAPAPTPTAAADFELPDHRGNVLRLGDQRGKVVFINFWATWCPPCIHEMPMMEQLYQSLRQQSFAIWAVNMQESQEDVGRFMASKRFHFPALVDVEGAIASRYMVRGLPTTYLIDCSGNLIGHVVGVLQWTSAATRTLVTALLEAPACEQSATTSSTPSSARQ